MRRFVISLFLALEGCLYAAFLALDLLGAPGPGVYLKYGGILLCLAFSLLCTMAGGDRLVPPALALTVLADLFLLVLNRRYALGVLLFLGVQTIYLIRLRRLSGKGRLFLRLALPLLIGVVMVYLGFGAPLDLLAGLYFSQLLINALSAWATPGQGRFALGLTLFVCCDLCVAARNTLPADHALFPFVLLGMWLFYLPSQVLIALSALPGKDVSHEKDQ